MYVLTPPLTNSLKCVNPTPALTQVGTPRHQLEVLIRQMDLAISSTKLAGRLAQFSNNWEQITQERWVLQAISGYELELTQTPWQAKPMPQIKCSTQEQEMISQEVKELLAKGAIIETTLSKESYVSQIFLVEKKEGGTEAGNKPEEPQYLHTSKPLPNGGSVYPSRSHPSSGLDDKNGLEGCLPSGTNPPGISTPSPVSVEWEFISFNAFHLD